MKKKLPVCGLRELSFQDFVCHYNNLSSVPHYLCIHRFIDKRTTHASGLHHATSPSSLPSALLAPHLKELKIPHIFRVKIDFDLVLSVVYSYLHFKDYWKRGFQIFDQLVQPNAPRRVSSVNPKTKTRSDTFKHQMTHCLVSLRLAVDFSVMDNKYMVRSSNLSRVWWPPENVGDPLLSSV